MTIIDVYLAHRDSFKFIEQQILLIRKFFKCKEGSLINIFCYIDGINENIKNTMREICKKHNVSTIEIPNIINEINRSYIGAGESYGLAFTYVYQNFILKNNNISVCIENDVFPFKDINIEEYIGDYEICGEVRFNAAQLPDRNVMFWLGFIIFNGEKMNDRDLFSGLCKPIINIESGKTHWIDCGGQSYYWIKNTKRNIKQMVTNGNEKYDGFTSLECTPHNITNDIHLLPEIFREGYHQDFRVLVYDNCLIHLERMGQETQTSKQIWWNHCFNKIYITESIYIPIGFQCTTAEILRKTNKRIYSFPFDWIISTPKSIVDLFSILFHENITVDNFVHDEFFKIDNFLICNKAEEFILNPNGKILFNSKYNLIFPHIENNNETIQKIIRRFNRLKDIVLSTNYYLKFLFINRLVSNNNSYTTQPTDKIKFSINDLSIDLNISENFNNLNHLLNNLIGNRFEIIIINAVDQINKHNYKFSNNIKYHELIPINNNNLTDEEIIQINI
jgi:hypothetical protein